MQGFLEGEGFVVGGDDHQHRRPRRLGVPGQFDRFGGADRAGLGYHWHAPGGLIDHRLDDQTTFRAAHRGELSGRSAGDDTVDATIDTAVDQAAQCVLVDLAVGREGCCEGGQDTAQL